MERTKIDNALQNERKKYLEYEGTHDVPGLESLYLRIAKEIPEDLDSNPLVIAMEECGELSQAIAKGIRGKADPVHLAEELADVSIITDYVKETWGIKDEDIRIIRALKLEQLEGIVQNLQKKYQAKLSPINMMNAFTTLREMTYDVFFDIYTDRTQAGPPEFVSLDTKCKIAGAFVDAHWRTTPQLNEDGINVLLGVVKTMKIRARNLITYAISYTGSFDYRPTPIGNISSNQHKLLWSIYQLDTLLWIIAMAMRRFSVLNAWVGDEIDGDSGTFNDPNDHANYVSGVVHTLGVRIREFIDYAEYNAPTVVSSSNTRKILNDTLNAIMAFENNVFVEIDRSYAESATWLQLEKLTKMMKGDDSNEGGSV